ncbi:MAG: Ribonuclease H [Dehalococcoidia bacterium]|nr:Ribonuclease H [Dehalococcoidia bacterium]
MQPPPTLTEENELWLQGYRFIAGLDEVGRGALAGPVGAGAVILPTNIDISLLDGVRDSKELTPAQRESLSPRIKKVALAFGIGMVSSEMVDEIGIVEATRRAMAQAIKKLGVSPEFLLVDALKLPKILLPQKAIIDGDKLSLSIACASIIAKVARDHLMINVEKKYPGYGFARHKGYGTPEHLDCLERFGPCPIHRRTFAPIAQGKLL